MPPVDDNKEDKEDTASPPAASDDAPQDSPPPDAKAPQDDEELNKLKRSAERLSIDKTSLDKSNKKLKADNARLRVLAGEEEEEEVKEEENDYVTKDQLQDSQWEVLNQSRIEDVKEDYEKILLEGYQGETVSKPVALALAEKNAGVDNVADRERQENMASTNANARSTEEEVKLTEHDLRFGLTAERKKAIEKEHPYLKELPKV